MLDSRVLASVIQPPSGLDPHGPAAAALTTLWWVMFWLAAVVFVVVVVLLAVSVSRQRQLPIEHDALTGERYAGGANLLMLVGGVAVPAVVVVVLMVLMITTSVNVRSVGNPADPLVVEVTGHKFWWDIEYPEAGVRTGNEIRIPVDTPVEFRLTSADVIHSFWVPQLGGKIDMTPGEVTSLTLQADAPGVYRGLCTEYCGIQHAQMHFVVVALPDDEFAQWLQDRTEPPAEPGAAVAQQGREVFESAQCVLCHTVDGVSPATDAGPDLTDFGGRLTLGAGARPNEPEHLAQWILDPHEIKPGNHMPPSRLNDEELEALLAYLETLR